MNNLDLQNKIEEVIKEVRNRYNLDFVNLGLERDSKFYVFGGVLRDMILNKTWKEVDIRVVINSSKDERDLKMESILKDSEILNFTKIPLGDLLTVYRFVPPKSKSNVDIDLSVEGEFNSAVPDFTINGLYLDIQSLELIDPYNSIEDIKNKKIRTVLNPDVQLENEPHMIFRAIKAACQFDFEIEKETLDAMRKYSHLTRNVMQTIVDKSMGGLNEWLLGNMLRGLKFNPKKFVDMWNDVGISREFLKFVSIKYGLETGMDKIQTVSSLSEESFETNLNLFFSEVSKIIDPDSSEKVFNLIIEMFEINKPKQFEDFVVDSSKIKFIS